MLVHALYTWMLVLLNRGVLLWQAAKSISTLLKPLEILTRPLPGHLRQGGDDPEMTPELERMFIDIRNRASNPEGALVNLPSSDELMERHLHSATVCFTASLAFLFDLGIMLHCVTSWDDDAMEILQPRLLILTCHF